MGRAGPGLPGRALIREVHQGSFPGGGGGRRRRGGCQGGAAKGGGGEARGRMPSVQLRGGLSGSCRPAVDFLSGVRVVESASGRRALHPGGAVSHRGDPLGSVRLQANANHLGLCPGLSARTGHLYPGSARSPSLFLRVTRVSYPPPAGRHLFHVITQVGRETQIEG